MNMKISGFFREIERSGDPGPTSCLTTTARPVTYKLMAMLSFKCQFLDCRKEAPA